jgi:hypothetical protein
METGKLGIILTIFTMLIMQKRQFLDNQSIHKVKVDIKSK